MNKIIFILVFSLVYLSASYYLFIRGYQALPNIVWLKIVYSVLFWSLSVSFIVSRATGSGAYFKLHEITTWIGVFWMAASLYLFLIVIGVDLVRLVNYFFTILPPSTSPSYAVLKQFMFVFSLVFVTSLLIYGNINARNPKVVKLEIDVPKNGGKYKKLRIAMASDIHLGTIVHGTYLKKMTDSINAQKPDIVLLPGDLIDESLGPILKYNIGAPLKNINAPLGVWAVPGNHEHIGDFGKATAYLEKLNVHFLIDDVALIDSSFYVVGRNDKDGGRFTGVSRKSLNAIMGGVDHAKPIVLMDHQPYHLEESMKEKVDLQLSGHTHSGQFWPFNYITSAIFEKDWGYLKKEFTHYYISSGYGTWGPPIRIGNHPELVIIDIHFVN